jgi:hypothetical protein
MKEVWKYRMFQVHVTLIKACALCPPWHQPMMQNMFCLIVHLF